MTEMKLSTSEEQALLALAAKSPLRGDKRTDAKAGTIHAPTAMRLVQKGLTQFIPEGYQPVKPGYHLTEAGKARLPGAPALQPSEKPECRKYLGRTLEGNLSVVCDKDAGHGGKCDNSEGRKLRRRTTEDKVSESVAKSEALMDSLPESTRKWAQECADRARGQFSKSAPVAAPEADDYIPAVLREALTAPKVSAAPAVLADALAPANPAPAFVGVSAEIDRLVKLLHESGTLYLRTQPGAKGKTFRINAHSKGMGFEYWMRAPDSTGWSRLPLGSLPAALQGVEFIDNKPEPGVQPFRPARGTVPAEVAP